ncbi:DUF6542 domain-containing protein [Mycobacterium sp. NPDC050551]|uniref:DUF6542 domain-containing protein n=1 Tax=Mycobacterium sp. NPDC050551 TaxID=3155407 RepID=UPI0034463484
MSGQRARPAVSADHRSVHPNFPGVPWWGAVLLAGTFTAIGFAFDAGSGDRQLSAVFSACYVLGCLLAVLAVRQNSIFTAVIQPPLILFASVPGAYFLFHGGQLSGLKDLAINCGYPLIERFPLMFFTAAAVLLIGMGRWYLGTSARRAAPAGTSDTKDAKPKRSASGAGLLSTVTAKVSALTGAATEDDDEQPPRKPAAAERPRRSARTAAGEAALEAREARGTRKPVRKATPSRSRHTRPPETELVEPVEERPRRTRSARSPEPPSAEPRRRPRSQSPREPRKEPPAERRSSYDAYERPERRRRYSDYDDYEPLEPHRTNGSNGSSTHHPVSRVRYRGADDSDRRTEYRTRPRRHSWDEYDSER